MSLRDGFSIQDIEDLWIQLWNEMFNCDVEPEGTKETATVIDELIRRLEQKRDETIKRL